MSANITVIIPTRLETARAEALARACRSVHSQQGVRQRVLLVINGASAGCAVPPGCEALHLPAANLQAARLAGRRAVTTPFFCFLDDDDELLPGALAARLAPMCHDNSIDVVVGKGWRESGGRLRPSGRHTEGAANALPELIHHNWLTSCGALYRSARVGSDFFADLPAVFEWTYLAFRLCLEKRVHFIDTPGHRIHDTPGSLSKSAVYHLGEVEVMQRILQLDLPREIRHALRVQHGRALHDLAEYYRRQHQIRRAWRAHLQSLIHPGGLQFLSFTRYLLPATKSGL